MRSNFLPSLLTIIGLSTGQLFIPGAATLAQTRASIHVLQRWSLGGNEGWGSLFFDPQSRLLYIPRTDRVVLLNTGSGQAVGEISGFVDARQVALDDSGKLGFVSDIMDGTVGLVRVFDRSTLKLIASIQVGRIPSAIVFDPATKSLFAFSSRDRNVSVIDVRTKAVIATIPLPGKPHIAVADARGNVFAGLRGIGEIVRIDAAQQKIAATWPIAPCVEFTGLTFDAGDSQLLGSCSDRKLISISAESGRVSLIGETGSAPGDLAFDQESGLLISAASSGVLTIFHQDSASHYTRQNEVVTLPRAATLALDPQNERIYLATAKFQQRPVNGKGMEEMESRLTPVPGSFVVLVAGP